MKLVSRRLSVLLWINSFRCVLKEKKGREVYVCQTVDEVNKVTLVKFNYNAYKI